MSFVTGTIMAPPRWVAMEALLTFLPARPQSLLVRGGATALLVGVFVVFRLGAGTTAGEYSFIFFIPPVLIAAIVFDHGTSVFATALSATAVAVMPPTGKRLRSACCGVDPVCGCRAVCRFGGRDNATALERGQAAREETDLLLQEQAHRIKNDLTIASSLIRLQAKAQKDEVVRAALESAVARLHVLAKGYDYLRTTRTDQVTDMQQYLMEVCLNVGEALRGIRPIAIEVDADRVATDGQKATRIGLIANELVTNALKHAFPDESAGNIQVTLRRTGADLTLAVEDNGIGCPDGATEGLGSRLTRLLVQQLHGNMIREAASPGCRIVITIPVRTA